MAGTLNNSSTLVARKPENENHTWNFPVPPKITFENKLEMIRNGGIVVLGQRTSAEMLSGVIRNASVSFHPKRISVQLDLQQHDDNNNRYIVKPSCLEFISQGYVKSRHEMDFQPTIGTVFTPTMLWYAIWLNNGSWDGTADTIRLTFKVSVELGVAGMSYQSSLLYKQSMQCIITALASYAEQDYSGFFPNSYLSDVTVICKGQTFPAHNIVLCNGSPVFNKILSPDMESKYIITIDNFDPEVVKAFLKFMYSGGLCLIQESLCNSLFNLADIFKVDALRKQCDQQLTYMVTPENCMDYFKKSVRMDAPFLRERCWQIITKNVREVVFRKNCKENLLFFLARFPDLLNKLVEMLDLD